MARLRIGRLVALVCLLGAARPALAEEEVRISLLSGPKRVRVSGKALRLYDADSGARLAAFSGQAEATLSLNGKKVAIDSGKKTRRRWGKRPRILVQAEGAIALENTFYFGRLEVSVGKKGLFVINRLPLETYLLGIVGAEMNPTWPLEALKAQAVAARTYAMERRVRMRALGRPYDLESTVISQVYKGAGRIRPGVIQAVKQTRGQVMAYDHRLIEALFHSTCGGVNTVSSAEAFGGELPYLQPVRCKWSDESPYRNWSASFKLREVERRLRARRLIRGRLRWVQRRQRDDWVRVRAGNKTYRIKPKKLRSLLGSRKLYSTRFSARTSGGKLHISGHGFGHGVGMSQYGALGMAKAGKSYRQILHYYYTNIRIQRIY